MDPGIVAASMSSAEAKETEVREVFARYEWVPPSRRLAACGCPALMTLVCGVVVVVVVVVRVQCES